MANLPTDSSLKPCLRPALGGKQAVDYILEQRVLKRYRWLLRESLAGPEALDQLLQQSFPHFFEGKQKERCQVYWQAEERVEHDVPEVIARLCHADLKRVAALIEQDQLLACIQLVWYELRPQLNKTDQAPRRPRLPKKPVPRQKARSLSLPVDGYWQYPVDPLAQAA